MVREALAETTVKTGVVASSEWRQRTPAGGSRTRAQSSQEEQLKERPAASKNLLIQLAPDFVTVGVMKKVY